jgi:2-dehydro-3-deoxy-D-gluconate 5-dehydrogenase
MLDLSDRVAVVTGGNGGIGLAAAKELARCGANVIIVGRNAEKNAAAFDQVHAVMGRAESIAADVTDERNVVDLMGHIRARYGRLDVLINNAGANDRKLPQDYTLGEWNNLIAVNLTTAFLVSQSAFPLLANSGRGKVVNVGSMLSLFGNARAAPYAAAKGGVVQLTKSLAQAWAKDCICVNAVLPGWIETDLTNVAKTQLANLDQQVLSRTPMGRWGQPADVAGAIVFLCSAYSDFITGAVVPVDGGYSSSS